MAVESDNGQHKVSDTFACLLLRIIFKVSISDPQSKAFCVYVTTLKLKHGQPEAFWESAHMGECQKHGLDFGGVKAKWRKL